MCTNKIRIHFLIRIFISKKVNPLLKWKYAKIVFYENRNNIIKDDNVLAWQNFLNYLLAQTLMIRIKLIYAPHLWQ